MERVPLAMPTMQVAAGHLVVVLARGLGARLPWRCGSGSHGGFCRRRSRGAMEVPAGQIAVVDRSGQRIVIRAPVNAPLERTPSALERTACDADTRGMVWPDREEFWAELGVAVGFSDAVQRTEPARGSLSIPLIRGLHEA